MSANPFADYHLVCAVVLVALATAGAVAARGLGEEWARLPFVSRNRWLLRTHRPRSFVLLCRSPS
jgi:thiosulfate dehydrogenase [quinone] large subunit